VAKTSPRRPRPAKRQKRAAAPTSVAGTGQIRYIEASALVAAFLEGDSSARIAIEADPCVTSALTFAEASRAIIRARASGRVSADREPEMIRGLRAIERRWFIVEITPAVLARVGMRFPVEPIRTLDAIHLATAEFLGEPPPLVTIVTRDARVAENARALGYAVED